MASLSFRKGVRVSMRPICHGVRMAPTGRIEGDVGTVYIGYVCKTCGHKEEVKLNNGN